MSLSYQQWGRADSRQQILLLHGWGMNSGVWSDIAQRLERSHPGALIRSVDLPGYGHSKTCDLPDSGAYTTQSLARSLLPLLDRQSTVIAWSMGGLVALDLLAEAKEQVSQLILVSCSPCFVRTENWSTAVEAGIFEAFCHSLAEDHQGTLKRFLAIQTLGSRTAREDIKTLQEQLFKRGEPDPQALEKGLQLLLNEDKRAQLEQLLHLPISLIAGKLDTLVNYQGQKQLAQQANITLYTIPAAGHAPFISHPEEFSDILQQLIPSPSSEKSD